jgi:ADP-heptose:LPS heptosyltransferase
LPDLAPFDKVFISPFAFTGSNEWSHNVPIPDKMLAGASPLPLDTTPEVEVNMWFARTLGFDGLTPPPEVNVCEESPVKGDYVVIAPGVQRLLPVWTKKCYPHWGVVASKLFDKSIQTVVVGAPSDNSPAWEAKPYINLCGKTSLWSLSGLLNRARVVVGVDNGPTCLSAALGRWSVVLWGPTSAEKNRKYGPRVVDMYSPVHCRPCQFRPDEFANCPHVNCMRAIDPTLVARYVLKAWEDGACESR